jgi:two-component system, response regulator GlnL
LKIFIIDDDIAIVKMLESIIEDYDLGKVCGHSLDGNCINDIISLKPDLVLVDLLIPKKDGITIVEELVKIDKNLKFIMISQVSSKNMISTAYTAGIDFFINKPINAIEVRNVIQNVSEKIGYEETLRNIKSIFSSNNESHEVNSSKDIQNVKIKKIQLILNKLGMTGEKGESDIVNICKYLIENDLNLSETSITEISNFLNQNPKSMDQRMRRAISKGLSNIAHLGIEDYMNEIFIIYSSSLFNFEEVKNEMDFIRGKRKSSGKVHIRKFIDGLIINADI